MKIITIPLLCIIAVCTSLGEPGDSEAPGVGQFRHFAEHCLLLDPFTNRMAMAAGVDLNQPGVTKFMLEEINRPWPYDPQQKRQVNMITAVACLFQARPDIVSAWYADHYEELNEHGRGFMIRAMPIYQSVEVYDMIECLLNDKTLMHGEVRMQGSESVSVFPSERVCDAACMGMLKMLGLNDNITEDCLTNVLYNISRDLKSTNMVTRDVAIHEMEEWYREAKPRVISNMWSVTRETEKLLTNRLITKSPRHLRIPALVSVDKMEILKRKIRDGCQK
jgi:hypothetical protein